MALTELQLPTKSELYNALRAAANKWNDLIHRTEDLAEFIRFMTTTDLDALGVPTGQLRTDLTNFRNMLNEIVSYFNNNPVTPSNAPKDVIDKVRTI